MSFSWMAAWAWIPLTLCAAAAQTARNTAQRSLTQELGTLPATLARFLYGLPFAGLWLVVLYAWPGQTPAVPGFSAAYLGWIALGAFFQVAATAALLLAMKERNFAVAVTLSKTEVLQVALFSSVFLHELPTPLALVAMVLATAGVLMLSLPPRGQMLSLAAWTSRSSLYGLACGACFALATVGFRGAALAVGRLGRADCAGAADGGPGRLGGPAHRARAGAPAALVARVAGGGQHGRGRVARLVHGLCHAERGAGAHAGHGGGGVQLPGVAPHAQRIVHAPREDRHGRDARGAGADLHAGVVKCFTFDSCSRLMDER
jgi:uncharacterized membrane protein